MLSNLSLLSRAVQRLFCLWSIFLLAGIAFLTGCSQQNSTESPAKVLRSADAVLTRMITAYHSAETYRDRAVVRLEYQRAGRHFEDEAPLSVAWRAPNHLHVAAYQVQVACDGEQLVARIEDEATRNFDGQFVVREAPERLTLRELWEEDEILSLAFRQGLVGYPLQLDLLLAKTPIAALMEDGVKRSLLDSAKVDGKHCYRVQVATNDGSFVLWVDQEQFVLRRIEYPVETFAAEILEDTSVTGLQLTVECRGATFDQHLPQETFVMAVPADAKRVKRLIPPPRELPSDLFGKTTRPYTFTALSGETVSDQSLSGRIKVFAWFNNHPACQSTIQQLNQVYRQYQSDDRIAIHAVCAEAASFTDQQVAALAKTWHVDLPIVRDHEALGRDLFKVPWAPTVVVLDENNVVQIYEIGANPNLVAELPQVLEQLLDGQDVAGLVLDQFRQEQAAYERALQRGEPLEPVTQPTSAPVASSTLPKSLQLRPLWENHDLQATGNVFAVGDAHHEMRFLVFEGWRTLTEIGRQGNLLGRHELDLPPQAGVSQLQTAVDSSGRRYYIAWSLRSPQVHLFDSQWKRLLSYPPINVQHEGVQDAVLGDLDGDGQLELHVGFWGTAGVHCVTLSGNRLWVNQEMSHVLSLMPTRRVDRRARLWVATASGAVSELDHHGRGKRVAEYSGELLHHVFCGAKIEDTTIAYCGISYGLEGRRLLIGLDKDAQSQWRYNLPAGSFATQLRFVTSAPLLDDAASHWLVAGADGSVHIISQDGRFTDFFQTGKPIAGLAGGRHAGAGILVVSNADGLQAWQISPPATARVK